MLYLTQPALHNLDCKTCWLYAIHDDTKKPIERRGNTGEFQKRGRGIAPPCKQCPKESPEKAAQHELSDKNWEAYQFYLRHRAMNFNGLTKAEKQDPIVQRNMRIIDEVMREVESRKQTQALMLTMQALMLKSAGVKKP